MRVGPPTEAELEVIAQTGEDLLDRILEEAGRAVEEAILERAGNPIAEWRDGRVVLVPHEEIDV